MVPFNPHLCAVMYNRIVRIGFEGSNRQQKQGDYIPKNWFDAWQSSEHSPVSE